jgi:hypothetical protein
MSFRVFQHRVLDADWGICSSCAFLTKTWDDWHIHSLAVHMDGGATYHTVALEGPRD